jgi:hypothetical protein
MTVVIMVLDPFPKQKTYLSDIWPWTSFTWTEDRFMTMNFVYLDRGQIYDHKRRWPGQRTDLWPWTSFTWTEDRSITMNFVYLDRGQIYDHKRHDHELRLPGQRTDLWQWTSFTWKDDRSMTMTFVYLDRSMTIIHYSFNSILGIVNIIKWNIFPWW